MPCGTWNSSSGPLSTGFKKRFSSKCYLPSTKQLSAWNATVENMNLKAYEHFVTCVCLYL